MLLLLICSSSFCLSFSAVSNTSLEKAVGPKKVAVAGATGRTGRLVVQRLLERESVLVIALVRDLIKAKETLPSDNSNVSIVQCDLSNPEDIKSGTTTDITGFMLLLMAFILLNFFLVVAHSLRA